MKYPSTSDLIAFKNHRFSLGFSSAYQHIFISAIKGLYKYLNEKDENGSLGGYYLYDIAKEVKSISRKPHLKKNVLILEDARHLIMCTKNNRAHIHHYRDHAMIMLMLTSALSPSEIINARKSNFKYKEGKKILFLNKKNERRYHHKVNLSDMTFEALKSYILKRNDSNPYLFISHRQVGDSKHLSRTFFYEMFPRVLKSCGFVKKAFTPHALRHSAALFYYENGASIEEVKGLLRHKHLSSTKMYEEYYQRLNSDAERKIESLLIEGH